MAEHLSVTTAGQGFTLGDRSGLGEQSATPSQYLLPQHLPRPWPSGAQNVPRHSIPAPSGSPPGYFPLLSVQRALAEHNGYLSPGPSLAPVGAVSLSLKHTACHITHTAPNFFIGLHFVLDFALSSLCACVVAHPPQLCLHNCLHFKVQLTCLFLQDVSSYCYLPSHPTPTPRGKGLFPGTVITLCLLCTAGALCGELRPGSE